jgi:hypothetical protein
MKIDIAELGLPMDCEIEPLDGFDGRLWAITVNPLGFVTIDFKNRYFGLGFGSPHLTRVKSTDTYQGKGWKKRIAADAYQHLKAV